MWRESHVRFGGRTAETHSLRDERGAAVRPYTYIPMGRGFLYLVAVMDWATRTVLSWRLSNTLDNTFCREALQEALECYGRPEIFNTDQGSQFTSRDFIEVLEQAEVEISMDGKGRWRDNVFIERLWRSLKYECVYLHEFEDGRQARQAIADWLRYYNEDRPHSSLAGTGPRWRPTQGAKRHERGRNAVKPCPRSSGLSRQPAKRPSCQVGKETSEKSGKRRTGQQINHNESTLNLLSGCPKNGVHLYLTKKLAVSVSALHSGVNLLEVVQTTAHL